MKYRKILSLSASALAINAALTGAILFMPERVYACTTVNSDTTISDSLTPCVVWTGGNLTLTPSGTINGGPTGINVTGASVGSLSNSGLIGAGYIAGFLNQGATIASVFNSSTGTISGGGSSNAFQNGGGTIGIITNDGFIGLSGGAGIGNRDLINSIVNNTGATISGGGNSGIYNGANIGAITNYGLITGGQGIDQQGSIGVINNDSPGTITGRTGIANFNNGSIGSISNSGLITGTVTGISSASGSTIGAITNDGKISGNLFGINNSGTLNSISNSDTIISNYTPINNNGGATINSILNNASGSIIGTGTGNAVANGGHIGTINNSGYIAGVAAVANSGIIDTIINSGIFSAGSGIYNAGTISVLSNSGFINGNGYLGLGNWGGVINNFTNSGSIAGGVAIINGAGGTISTLNNMGGGIINGNNTGIINEKVIGSLTNSGTITGAVNGILNTAATSGSVTISNGTIGTLTNSGLIEGANAIYSGNGDTILSAITNTGTIAGNINVAQALTLTGGSAGALGSLTGYNSAVGTISTNNNNLTFDSGAYQLMDDDINVGASNTVFNNGLIRVNTTHTVTGNYSQAPSATLVVGVTDSSHYGELVISGTATLTGSSVLITPTSGSLSNGETLTIVQASNSGTSYSGVSATAAGFTATTSTLVSGGYDDLIVALSNGNGGSHTYATLGQNAGGVGGSVGAALDQIAALVAGGNQSSFAPILTALNNIGSQQSPAAEAAAIKQLAPSQLAPQLTATNLMANQTMDVIGQHQTTLLEQHGRGGTGKAAGSEIQAGVLWMQVDGGFASQASSASVAGYHQNFYGMTFGVDDHITKKATAGVAVSWVHSASRGSDSLNGDAVAVSTPEVSAYGSYRFGPAFVDGMLGVGYNMYSQSRGIGFLGSTASSSYGGMQYMGNLESGYDFTVTPRTTVTPLVGLQAVRTATDSYSETGAGAADLTVGHQIIDSYASSLGGRVTTVIPTVLGSLTPEVKLAWAHNLNNGAINTSATMAGVGFATSTPRSSPDGAELSLAATLQRTDNLSLRAEYDGDLRDGYQSHTGMLKGAWDF